MKELTRKVRINRKKWRTGGLGQDQTGIGDTSLLNEEGYMCCLGFAAKQLGKISNDKVLLLGEPDELCRVISPLTEKSERGDVENT